MKNKNKAQGWLVVIFLICYIGSFYAGMSVTGYATLAFGTLAGAVIVFLEWLSFRNHVRKI